jgi:hypothetical protein
MNFIVLYSTLLVIELQIMKYLVFASGVTAHVGMLYGGIFSEVGLKLPVVLPNLEILGLQLHSKIRFHYDKLGKNSRANMF